MYSKILSAHSNVFMFFSTHTISSKFGHLKQSNVYSEYYVLHGSNSPNAFVAIIFYKKISMNFFLTVSDILKKISIIHVNHHPVFSSFVWIKLEEIGQGNIFSIK